MRVLDLNDHHYFVQAVDHGGFAAAGRALGIPKSTFSRRVIELETRLGVRLIERSSRSFAMTEVGRAFYRHAKAMLLEAEAAERVVLHRLAEPTGTIRMTCSFGMARVLGDVLVRFVTEYPKVRLVQHATNYNVDLIEAGFDIAVRGHEAPLPDSGLIVRRLAETPWHLFAAPVYLKTAGTPTQPGELASHATLALASDAETSYWRLSGDGEEVVVPIEPRVRSSDMETLKVAATAGLGIVSLPGYVAREQLADGRLRRVLPAWLSQRARISILTPSRRGQLPSVRALIDYLVAEFPGIVDPTSGPDRAGTGTPRERAGG